MDVRKPALDSTSSDLKELIKHSANVIAQNWAEAVRADRAIVKAPQAGKQRIDQVVLEAVILVSDESEEMQIAVRIVAANELENFRSEHAVGIVQDSSGLQSESLKGWPQLMIKVANQIQIGHALFNLRRLG